MRRDRKRAPEWFVELDIVAKEMGGKGYTWLSVAILEDDYKAHPIVRDALRPPSTSRPLGLQREDRINARRQCLFPSSKLSSAFTADHGVVVTVCTRLMFRQMLQDVGVGGSH